jgi:nucleoside permease NupC
MPGSSTLADLNRIRWLLCYTQMVIGAILCPLAWLLGAGWINSAIISATYTLIAASVCYITLS